MKTEQNRTGKHKNTRNLKFQGRIVLYYATIALLLSLLFGTVFYLMAVRFERQSRRNNLDISSRQLVAQLNERLGRMEAIMNYILSDPTQLTNMRTLGQTTASTHYVNEAQASMRRGMNLDYVLRNTYRTAFYNQNNLVVSSFSRGRSQRINEHFSYATLPYIEAAQAAGGRAILVGAHSDGLAAEEGELVYSLVKAVQGQRMGFLETMETVDSLAGLEHSDESLHYLIYVSNEAGQSELLYADEGAHRLMEDKPTAVETDASAAGPDTRLTLERVSEAIEDGSIDGVKVDSQRYAFSMLVLTEKPGFATQWPVLLLASVLALSVFAVGLAFVIFWSYILVKPIRKLTALMESTTWESMQNDSGASLSEDGDELHQMEVAYRSMTGRLNQALVKEKHASLLSLQSQFDALQAQVNPHFLYNVLNIISARSVLLEDEEISLMCAALAGMLRYSTNNKERYASIGQELDYLDSYFFLLKKRYEERLEIEVDIPESMKGEIIPKLTFQQIVENCILHGFNGQGDRMRICIEGETQDRGWKLTVTDNGCGIAAATMERLQDKLRKAKQAVLEQITTLEVEIGGMGIVNTYTRCLILYPDRLHFEIRNTGNGTCVCLGVTGRKQEKMTENKKR